MADAWTKEVVRAQILAIVGDGVYTPGTYPGNTVDKIMELLEKMESSKRINADTALQWLDECQQQNSWGHWGDDYAALANKINEHFKLKD
jgi:hypothetical protein